MELDIATVTLFSGAALGIVSEVMSLNPKWKNNGVLELVVDILDRLSKKLNRDRPMSHIVYRSGYKYQLAAPYEHRLAIIRPEQPIYSEFYFLGVDGLLRFSSGYAWDGPSGPTFDTLTAMRGSLVHDCLYQMIRRGELDPSWRDEADLEMYRIFREDDMWSVRAAVWKNMVNHFGDASADPANKKQLIIAP